MSNSTTPIQIKVKPEEKNNWQILADKNGFISIPTMIRYLVTQYDLQTKKFIGSNLEETLNLVQRIKEGKEELFSGDLYELAEK